MGVIWWPNLELMQVEPPLAGEITQVLDAIPWVRCASGNVLQNALKLHFRCGVCSDLVLFDNDAIAVHLKSGNHPRISHKDYNRYPEIYILPKHDQALPEIFVEYSELLNVQDLHVRFKTRGPV